MKANNVLAKNVGLTPGMPIASSGLAMALFMTEVTRLSSYQNVSSGTLPDFAGQAIALAVVAALALAYSRKPTLRIHRQTGAGVSIAMLYAVSTFVASGQSAWAAGETTIAVAMLARRLCEPLLLVQWAELLVLMKARTAARTFALAVVGVAALNLFTVFVKVQMVGAVISLLPILSVVCLYWFKAYSASMDDGADADGALSSSVDRFDDFLTRESPSGGGWRVVVYALPVLFYAFAFGNVHFSWVPLQDGASLSLSVQLGAATGTLLGGAIALLMVSWFWGARRLELYGLIILPLLLLSMYLTATVDSQWSFLYVVLLNVAQKLALFLVWMAPFAIPTKGSVLLPWSGCICLYGSGKLLSSVASAYAAAQYGALATISVIALIVLGTVSFFSNIDAASASCAAEGCTEDGGSPSRQGPDSEQEPATHASAEADELDPTVRRCRDAAAGNRLTRREEEVLRLLMQGHTAAAIAETLVVSTSTAKSHIRNIYAKMGVHTQNELILKVMGR